MMLASLDWVGRDLYLTKINNALSNFQFGVRVSISIKSHHRPLIRAKTAEFRLSSSW